MRVTASVVLFSVLALSACQRREEKAEAPQPPKPPAPAAAPAAPKPPAAAAFKRKPGLWEMQMSMDGIDFVQTAQSCVKAGENDDATAFNPQAESDACREHTVSRQLDGSWRFRTVCDMGSGGRVSVTGVASGDFDRRYQVRSEMVVTGAAVPQMNRTTTLNVDARRIGDC